MAPRKLACLLVVAVLIAVNCSRTGPAAGMRFTDTALPDGEVCEYRLLVAGTENGAMVTAVQYAQFGGVAAYRIDIVAKTRDGAAVTTDSSVVFVTRDSMVPLTTFRFIRTGDALVTTAANYSDSTVAVSTYAQGREKQQLLPFGPRTYDTDQLTTLGRVIQVLGRKPVEIQVVSPVGPPFGGSVIPAQVSSAGSEQATVPAGTFNCYKITYTMSQSPINVWYEKDGAHRMIRYETGDGELAIELTASQ